MSARERPAAHADETDDRAVGQVRALIERADFSAEGIRQLGVEVGMGVRRHDVPILSRALESHEPLATLVRLFVLGESLDAAALTATVGDAVPALVAAGLARADGGRIEPVVRLTPWRDRVFAHDPDPPGDLWPDHVSGPTPAAETLLRVVAPNGRTALDLGTGCGVLAVSIAGGQQSVVATDVNAAALRFTALNAALNAMPGVRTAEGSWFEPVMDDRFDLVVSNPPFVVSPESELLFRHSAFGRDEVSRHVVTGTAEHLADGGLGYVMVNWVQPPGRRWLDVLRGWLEGTGCDALCLLHGVEDPLAYAVRWNAREQALRPDRYTETLDRWLAHFERERIEAIASGIVVLRRRPGANWVHGLELSGEGSGDASGQVRAIIRGRDFLHGDGRPEALVERLVGSAFRIEADHRLLQTLAARSGEYVVEPASLVLDEGLGLDVPIEPDLIQAVLRFDGTQTVRDIGRELADATGGDRATVTGRVAAIAQLLVERGIAIPVVRPG